MMKLFCVFWFETYDGRHLEKIFKTRKLAEEWIKSNIPIDRQHKYEIEEKELIENNPC